MPGLRQQRGNPWRGKVPFKALAVAEAITWTVVGIGTDTVELALGNVTGNLTLHGFPDLACSGPALTPIGATLTLPSSLFVQYDANLSAGFTYTLGEKDPALRSSTGAYMAAGAQVDVVAISVGLQFFTGVGPFTPALSVSVYEDAAMAGLFQLPTPTFVGEWYILGTALLAFAQTVVNDHLGVFLASIAQAGSNRFTWDGANWQIT